MSTCHQRSFLYQLLMPSAPWNTCVSLYFIIKSTAVASALSWPFRVGHTRTHKNSIPFSRFSLYLIPQKALPNTHRQYPRRQHGRSWTIRYPWSARLYLFGLYPLCWFRIYECSPKYSNQLIASIFYYACRYAKYHKLPLPLMVRYHRLERGRSWLLQTQRRREAATLLLCGCYAVVLLCCCWMLLWFLLQWQTGHRGEALKHTNREHD